ncbi:MAG: M28 family peptidase [Kiritimatiellae bacterium]|nr:M28 family peptidase [Kiritimatiellia bacterium]
MTSFLLAATLLFAPADADIAYDTASELVKKHTPRDSGTLSSRRAADFIYDRLKASGAKAELDFFKADTPAGERYFVNVESAFVSNTNNEWIVFVSHFDTKKGVACPGANDGASTTGLLIALAGKLAKQNPEKINVLLLWTDGEECFNDYAENDGLWGSRHAAKKLRDSGVKVRAVVCFDMLGDKDLKITIPENSHQGFRDGILKIAKRKNLADKIVAVDDMVIDDHVPFLEAGFKAVDLIDFDYGSRPGLNDYWHTSKDTIDKISRESLLLAGEIATWLINGLDR